MGGALLPNSRGKETDTKRLFYIEITGDGIYFTFCVCARARVCAGVGGHLLFYRTMICPNAGTGSGVVLSLLPCPFVQLISTRLFTKPAMQAGTTLDL